MWIVVVVLTLLLRSLVQSAESIGEEKWANLA